MPPEIDAPEVITEPVVAPPAWVPLTQQQTEALQRERDESRESERYWSDRARATGKAPAAEAEATGDEISEFLDPDAAEGLEGDTAEKLVDDLANKGIAALKSRGLLTAKEARKIAVEAAERVVRGAIASERSSASISTQLDRDFPELKDRKSELYAATAKIYQEAVAMDPSAAKSPAALFLAAKAAKAAMKPAKVVEDDTEDETGRRQRVDSQDGSRTRGRGNVEDREEPISAEDRDVMKACGITEAEFKEHRKLVGRGRR